MIENWNKLKETADGLGSDLDVHAAWERFEDKKKKKKRGFFFLGGSLGALLILGLVVGYFLLPTNSDENKLTGEIIQSSRQSNSLINSEKDVTDQLYSKMDQGEAEVLNKKEKKSFTRKNTSLKELKNNVDSAIENQQKPQQKTLAAKKGKSSSSASDPRKESLENSSTFQTSVKQAINATTEAANQAVEKSINRTSDAINFEAPTEELKAMATTFSISTIKPLGFQLFPIEKEPKEHQVSFSIKKKKKFRWAIHEYNFILGYGQVQRKLLGDINTRYINRRNIGETFRNHAYAKISATTYLKKNFSLEYGLGLNRYQSRLFEVTQIIEQGVVFPDQLLEEKIKDGMSTLVYGDVIGNQTTVTERVRYQQYFDINAEIQLSYNVRFFKKLWAKLSSGFGYGFVAINHGSTYASEFSFGEFTDLSELGYKKGLLVKSTSDLILSYDLNDNHKLNLGVNYQFDLVNRLTASTNQSDQFSSANIILGYTIKL